MTSKQLVLPAELLLLMTSGVWPTTKEQELAQNSRQIVAKSTLQAFIPDEFAIYFLRPPFMTVAQRIALGNKFWLLPEVAINQIDPDLTLDIASFGPGSDTSLALDYRSSTLEPSVMRLQWFSEDPTRNRWVTVSPTFAEFCRAIGLLS